MESDIEAGLWATELESLLLRMGQRFSRIVPRRRMQDYARGLLGPVGRKNSWQLAEHAGHATPYGLQRPLSASGIRTRSVMTCRITWPSGSGDLTVC